MEVFSDTSASSDLLINFQVKVDLPAQVLTTNREYKFYPWPAKWLYLNSKSSPYRLPTTGRQRYDEWEQNCRSDWIRSRWTLKQYSQYWQLFRVALQKYFKSLKRVNLLN